MGRRSQLGHWFDYKSSTFESAPKHSKLKFERQRTTAENLQPIHQSGYQILHSQPDPNSIYAAKHVDTINFIINFLLSRDSLRK